MERRASEDQTKLGPTKGVRAGVLPTTTSDVYDTTEHRLRHWSKGAHKNTTATTPHYLGKPTFNALHRQQNGPPWHSQTGCRTEWVRVIPALMASMSPRRLVEWNILNLLKTTTVVVPMVPVEVNPPAFLRRRRLFLEDPGTLTPWKRRPLPDGWRFVKQTTKPGVVGSMFVGIVSNQSGVASTAINSVTMQGLESSGDDSIPPQMMIICYQKWRKPSTKWSWLRVPGMVNYYLVILLAIDWLALGEEAFLLSEGNFYKTKIIDR